jgi:hypothetical protein
MAEQCDYLLAYEWDTYRAARPIAYTNWPTLDPLRHVTEPTALEERELRRRAGLPRHPRLLEYDNDGVALDAMLVRPTPANQAGYFAAFHAYPYYPDFIVLDSARYLGYLRALRQHHAGRPVVIAEYGVPSSRGVAHLTSDGRDHGGHDETAMAAVDVALTQDIRAAGLAGGILFAWLDEWFKHNWVVVDLEQPAERTPLWHNVENAEQNYGLLGQYAGTGNEPVPGVVDRWVALPIHVSAEGLVLRAGTDESYLYLALQDARRPDADYYIVGIDTYRADRGEFRLPGLADTLQTGVEFALVLTVDGADLRVASHYNPFLGPRPGLGPTQLDRLYNFAATADKRSQSGSFDSLFVATNRFRIARDGRTFPARGVNRGRLLARDWFINSPHRLVGVRLPWNLLNVTDPSSRHVLRAVREAGPFATDTSPGFRFVAVAVKAGRVAARAESRTLFTWARWDTPRWHERLKPAYAAMRDVWGKW